jgi:hypothetical protein
MNWRANIRDTRAFLRDGFGTDNLAMAANVRERLSVGKLEAQKFDTEEFDLKKVNWRHRSLIRRSWISRR